MTLSIYQYQALNYTTNTPLPGANVSVYVGSSNTLDTIYSILDGTATNNPVVADSNAMCQFQADSADTVIVSAGSYVSPRLMLANVGSSGSNLGALTTLVTNLEAIYNATEAIVQAIQSQIISMNDALAQDVSTIDQQMAANLLAGQQAIADANAAAQLLNNLVIDTIQPAVNAATAALATATEQLNTILVTTIPAMDYTAASNTAAISTEAGARATADTALAGQLNTLSASVGASNYLLWSSDLTNGIWAQQGSNIAPWSTAPDGSGAFQLSEDTSTAAHQVLQTAPQTFIAGQFVTGSVYLRNQSGITAARLYVNNGTYLYAEFDLNAGTIEDQNGYAASITPCPNGWFRVSFTVQMAVAAESAIGICTQRGGSTSYAGDPGYGLGIWGPQLTATMGPVPYVATQDAPITPTSIATLITEQVVQAGLTSALSGQYTSLNATVGQNAAQLSAQQIALVNSTIASSTSVLDLTAEFSANNTAISQNASTLSVEQIALVTSTIASSASISQLTADFAQNSTDITTNEAAAVSANNTTAGILTNINSAFAATNYLVYSNTFDQADFWTNEWVTLAPGGGAPDGTSAYSMTETSDNNSHGIAQTITTQFGSGEYCTASIYVYPGCRTHVIIYVWQGLGTSYASASFDLSAGTVTGINACYDYYITPINYGWYRISITAQMLAAANPIFYFRMCSPNDGYVGVPGDGVGCYIWDAQVTANTGSPGAYIVTTTVPLVNQPSYVNANANLAFEQITRASADQSLSAQLLTLTSSLNTGLTNASASLSSAQVTQVNSTVASSTYFTTLSASVAANFQTQQAAAATLSVDQIAIVTSTVASSSTANNLQSQINANAATLYDGQITLVNQTIAASSIITNLANDYNTQQAQITGNATAATDANSSVAANVSTLQATYNSTNYVCWSQDFTQASVWNLQNGSMAASGNAPDQSTCWYFAEDESTSQHQFSQTITTPFSNQQQLNGSIYVYSAGDNEVSLNMSNGSNWIEAVFNLSNGTVVSSNGCENAYCSLITQNWYRISMTISMAVEGNTLICSRLMSGGQESYAGTGNGAYFWGAQVTATYYPIAYLETTTSPLVNQPSYMNANSFLSFEQSVRSTADLSLSAQITSLSSSVSGNFSTVNQTLATLTDPNASSADSVTALNSVVNNNYAYFQNASVTNANNISLTNGNLTNLGDEVGTNYGEFQTLSASVQTLSTTSSGHTASIESVIGSVNGIEVLYGVKGYINGQTGGFVFQGIEMNNGSVSYSLEIDANVTINGSLVVNGTINTAQITNNAVTNSSYLRQNQFGGGLGLYMNCVAGYPVLINCTFDGGTTVGASGPSYMRFQANFGDVLDIYMWPLTSPTSDAQGGYLLGSTAAACTWTPSSTGSFPFQVFIIDNNGDNLQSPNGGSLSVFQSVR